MHPAIKEWQKQAAVDRLQVGFISMVRLSPLFRFRWECSRWMVEYATRMLCVHESLPGLLPVQGCEPPTARGLGED